MTVRRVRGKPMINIPKDFGVGFRGDARYPDGERVVDVAGQNEFGDSFQRIPPRPFLSYSAREISSFVDFSRDDARDACVGIVQQAIEDWDAPPNAQLTILLKGFDNPLIHTRMMKDSVEAFDIEA